VSRSYGPRVDPLTGGIHARVSDAIDYSQITTLWQRRVGNGTLRCELLRGHKPSRRKVQLVAEYSDAGSDVLRMIVVDDELEEARAVRRIEQAMLAAQARPTGE